MRRLLLLLVLTTSGWAGVVEEGLSQLSWHEQACMRAFFDEALRMEQASHVLFYETKPACLMALILKDQHKTFKNNQCLKGWDCFKKHEHLFPHPDFILNENRVAFDDDFVVLHIYFINKQTLEKCVRQNIDLFKNHFGKEFTFESFSADLQKYGLRNLLEGNETLHGVILGFGNESAQAYHLANANQERGYVPPETEVYCQIDIKRPKACKMGPVVFMGDPHSDQVKQLCTAYEHEMAEAWQAYKSTRGHLKMILKALCSEE
jgi:hypothetical protein